MQTRTSRSSARLIAACLAISVVGCTDDGSDVTTSDGGGEGHDSMDAGDTQGDAGGHHVDGDSTDAGGEDALDVEGDRRIPFTPANDRAFAEYFVEHHQMAVHMADEVVERGEAGEVKALAMRIIEAQSQEIETLQAAIKVLGDEPTPPAMPTDAHAEAEMEHMMTMSGAELDHMFLIDMIAHHATALPVTHRALAHLERADLKALAEKMFEDQGREIGEIRNMLKGMGIDEAGEDLAPRDDTRADFGLEGDRRIPMTPADDVAFIDFFVPHHEMAMHMAEEVISRGADVEVRAMAQAMLAMQMSEVNTMRMVRMKLTGEANSPPMPSDPHADPEMARMGKMSGEELDTMFLMEMIPHHASGLPTAHRAVPHVVNEALRTMAKDMFNAQAEEIGRMREILDGRDMN